MNTGIINKKTENGHATEQTHFNNKTNRETVAEGLLIL